MLTVTYSAISPLFAIRIDDNGFMPAVCPVATDDALLLTTDFKAMDLLRRTGTRLREPGSIF